VRRDSPGGGADGGGRAFVALVRDRYENGSSSAIVSTRHRIGRNRDGVEVRRRSAVVASVPDKGRGDEGERKRAGVIDMPVHRERSVRVTRMPFGRAGHALEESLSKGDARDAREALDGHVTSQRRRPVGARQAPPCPPRGLDAVDLGDWGVTGTRPTPSASPWASGPWGAPDSLGGAELAPPADVNSVGHRGRGEAGTSHPCGSAAARSRERDLRTAAGRGDLATVEALLRSGVDPNGRDDELHTALHHAACSDRYDAVRALLQGGGAADARDLLGYTPLHVCAVAGHARSARVLIEGGADVNLDSGGGTPLELAMELNKFEILQLLRASGAGGVRGGGR
jgi:hypothetical protein